MVCIRIRSGRILIFRFSKYWIRTRKSDKRWTMATYVIVYDAGSKRIHYVNPYMLKKCWQISSQGESLVSLVKAGKSNLDCKDEIN